MCDETCVHDMTMMTWQEMHLVIYVTFKSHHSCQVMHACRHSYLGVYQVKETTTTASWHSYQINHDIHAVTSMWCLDVMSPMSGHACMHVIHIPSYIEVKKRPRRNHVIDVMTWDTHACRSCHDARSCHSMSWHTCEVMHVSFISLIYIRVKKLQRHHVIHTIYVTTCHSSYVCMHVMHPMPILTDTQLNKWPWRERLDR